MWRSVVSRVGPIPLESEAAKLSYVPNGVETPSPVAFRINLVAYCGYFRLWLADLELHHDSSQETAVFCTLEYLRGTRASEGITVPIYPRNVETKWRQERIQFLIAPHRFLETSS